MNGLLLVLGERPREEKPEARESRSAYRRRDDAGARTRLPTSGHDLDPFVGERTHRRLVRLALRTLLHVEGSRPERVLDRFPGVLDEALPLELRAAESPVHREPLRRSLAQ